MQKHPEIEALLAQILEARNLSESQLEQLGHQTQLTRVEPNWQIRRHELRGLRLFLANGDARCHYDGLECQVNASLGLSEPVELLAGGRREDDLVVAETNCLLLRFPDSALADVEQDSALEVSDIELDDVESDFLSEIYQRIGSNCLELPARPEVALQIQQLTADPEAGIEELTKLIQSDGTVAGALLHTTNSPVFRATKKIASVRDAVIRIGFDNTRKLATNSVFRSETRESSSLSKAPML